MRISMIEIVGFIIELCITKERKINISNEEKRFNDNDFKVV